MKFSNFPDKSKRSDIKEAIRGFLSDYIDDLEDVLTYSIQDDIGIAVQDC